MNLIDWIKLNLPMVGETLAWVALCLVAGNFLLPLVQK